MSFELKNRWALVTGASSGIGAEFARQLAACGTHLVLTARRGELLNELAEELQSKHNIQTRVFPADLSQAEEIDQLLTKIHSENLQIDLVINNAGFGSVTNPEMADQDHLLKMVDVNVRAVTQISYAFLTEMLERNSGTILNVSSVVGFQPVNYMGVYAASKAFVLSLSEALSAEIGSSQVQVITLCPATTRTDFFDSAGAKGWLNRFPGLTPEYVVRKAILAIRKQQRLCVPGWNYQLMTFLPRIMPRGLNLFISKMLFKQTIQEKEQGQQESEGH